MITIHGDTFSKKGHGFKAFFRRLFLELFSKNHSLSGSAICPSYVTHTVTATFRADADIYFPDCLYQFSHGKTGISGLKTLMSLNGEDQFQVFALAPVIQEAIVTDPLEPVWEYMHQKPADEFRMIQGDVPAWIPCFPAPGRKSYFFIIER